MPGGNGWLRDAIEAAAWDGLAQRIDQRTFTHLWAWEYEQAKWRKESDERVYDHEIDGL